MKKLVLSLLISSFIFTGLTASELDRIDSKRKQLVSVQEKLQSSLELLKLERESFEEYKAWAEQKTVEHGCYIFPDKKPIDIKIATQLISTLVTFPDSENLRLQEKKIALGKDSLSRKQEKLNGLRVYLQGGFSPDTIKMAIPLTDTISLDNENSN